VRVRGRGRGRCRVRVGAGSSVGTTPSATTPSSCRSCAATARRLTPSLASCAHRSRALRTSAVGSAKGSPGRRSLGGCGLAAAYSAFRRAAARMVATTSGAGGPNAALDGWPASRKGRRLSRSISIDVRRTKAAEPKLPTNQSSQQSAPRRSNIQPTTAETDRIRGTEKSTESMVL
jgi:hypothetical protein